MTVPGTWLPTMRSSDGGLRSSSGVRGAEGRRGGGRDKPRDSVPGSVGAVEAFAIGGLACEGAVLVVSSGRQNCEGHVLGGVAKVYLRCQGWLIPVMA